MKSQVLWCFFDFLKYVYVGLVLTIAFFHAIVVIFGKQRHFLTLFSPVGYLDG